jgi:hypothetical protein
LDRLVHQAHRLELKGVDDEPQAHHGQMKMG